MNRDFGTEAMAKSFMNSRPEYRPLNFYEDDEGYGMKTNATSTHDLLVGLRFPQRRCYGRQQGHQRQRGISVIAMARLLAAALVQSLPTVHLSKIS
jgi:hypothetical protein